MTTAHAIENGQPRRMSRWITILRNRWPSALALLLTGLTFGGTGSPEAVGSLSEVLLILPLLYLLVAKLRNRRATWPLLVGGIGGVVALRVFDLVSVGLVLSVLALVVLVWGALDGELHRPGAFRVQALGMLVFGALSLAGLVVEPDLGRYVVAAGWFFHGVWDYVHLARDRVVARSFAEWCAIVDIGLAIELAFAL